jgi:hypothetical protein
MKKALFIILSVVVLLSFSSCTKDKVQEEVEEPVLYSLNGLGNNAGEPTGEEFELPTFVKIIGEIRGGEMPGAKTTIDKSIPAPQLKDGIFTAYGTGIHVHVYMGFLNTLGADIVLNIPGGLMFLDNTRYTQHGIILQDAHIPIDAYDTVYVRLEAYCLNKEISGGGNYNTIYEMGSISNFPDLDKIISIMKTKQLPVGSESSIQTIIWNVTDGTGITEADIDYLNSLL